MIKAASCGALGLLHAPRLVYAVHVKARTWTPTLCHICLCIGSAGWDFIHPDETSIAEMMAAGSYTTAQIGKWHNAGTLGWVLVNGVMITTCNSHFGFKDSLSCCVKQPHDCSHAHAADITLVERGGSEKNWRLSQLKWLIHDPIIS